MDDARGSVTNWWAYAHQHVLRYRLAVLAPNARHVVEHAGGWLFDRAMSGWEVTVALTDVSDVAPLRILGATVLEWEGPLAVPMHHRFPNVLAVDPELLATDDRIRVGLLESLRRGLFEVVLWDQTLPAGFDELAGRKEYELSVAALAFKRQALTMVGATIDSLRPTERFRGTADMHKKSVRTTDPVKPPTDRP